MAVATSLVTFLEGINLEGAPPCEIWDDDGNEQCGAPSVARVIVDCEICQASTKPRFVCSECLTYFQDKCINHMPCGTLITNWKRA